MDDLYQLGCGWKRVEIFVLLIGVVVGGSKFFTKSGVRSDVGCLPFVYCLVLISYHYNDTLDHPECHSELLWTIQSISPNPWMVQSNNLENSRIAILVHISASIFSLVLLKHHLFSIIHISVSYCHDVTCLEVLWIIQSTSHFLALRKMDWFKKQLRVEGWLYYQYIYQPVFQSRFT